MTSIRQDAHPKYRVPALEKGLDILEHLSAHNVPQSQAEIARALGRTSSEIFRMLDCLEQRRYLIRDQHSGRYALSLRLFELAHTHAPIEQLLWQTREPMRDFANGARESVHLGILQGHDLLILAQQENPGPVRLSISVGSTQPALKTTSGCLLVAHLADDRRERFLADDPHFQQLGSAAQQRLRRQLAAAAGSGYLIADSHITVGVRDVSVLVGNRDLGLVAALACPVLMLIGQEPDFDSIRQELQHHATAITSKLGLNHDHPAALSEAVSDDLGDQNV